MKSAYDILDQIDLLPEQEREFILNTLQERAQPTSEELKQKWIDVANQRLDQALSGKAKTIPADEVFAKHEEQD